MHQRLCFNRTLTCLFKGLIEGFNLIFHPDFLKMMSDANFLSKSGHSHSFDERADGYARGEGFAVVVLKRLSDAIRDGDPIRAVIRNTGINQDGKTAGITQPNGASQTALIRQTFERGNLQMRLSQFFEAHRTGTPVGDPIEANAIGEAFHDTHTEDDPLYLGAVKANIGHLGGCSGLAALIKAILALERGIIPPIAGFKEKNHRFDRRGSVLRVSCCVVVQSSDLSQCTVSTDSHNLA